jgi:hypothetical protein
MKKLIFISILLVSALFFAFNRPDDRPKGVDSDHWIKINDELGIRLDLGKSINKAAIIPGEWNGKIMFKKDDKWYTLICQDSKVSNKFLNNK